MSEIKHTKGPWTAHDKGEHPHPYVCGPTVALEHGEDQFVVAYLVGMDTAANARLIAAAPDLLEMAKWAEAAIAPFSKDPAEKSGIVRLRAAIAKAEGH